MASLIVVIRKASGPLKRDRGLLDFYATDILSDVLNVTERTARQQKRTDWSSRHQHQHIKRPPVFFLRKRTY